MVLSVYTGQFVEGHIQCASDEDIKLIVNNVTMKYKGQEMGSNGVLIITTEYIYFLFYQYYYLKIIDLYIGLYHHLKCVLVI